MDKSYFKSMRAVNQQGQTWSDMIRQERFELRQYSELDNPQMASLLCLDLHTYLGRTCKKGLEYFSFIASFRQTIANEEHFSNLLRSLLYNLQEEDRQQFYWDNTAPGNLPDTGFSLSLGGRLFYLTALHPQSADPRRQFPKPMIIFCPMENLLGQGMAQA